MTDGIADPGRYIGRDQQDGEQKRCGAIGGHSKSALCLRHNLPMDLRLAARAASPTLLLRLSIVVAIATIALKTTAWWITDSVGLLSDAMESLVNLASAAFALLMVTIARRPADADHPYGHHKAEYFSSGFEGLMIIVAALGIAWAAAQRLFIGTTLRNPQINRKRDERSLK